MSTASIIILKNNENVTFVMNPSITYFKSVFRKHTKFTIAYKEEQPIQVIILLKIMILLILI